MKPAKKCFSEKPNHRLAAKHHFTLIELLINDACFTWVYVLY